MIAVVFSGEASVLVIAAMQCLALTLGRSKAVDVVRHASCDALA